MPNEEIFDMIDTQDKQELEKMVNTKYWNTILKNKELMEYYNMTLRLKETIPAVDLWDKFQDRLEHRTAQRSVLKKGIAAAAVAVLLITGGLIFITPKVPREYSYAHLLENNRELRSLEYNEHVLNELKDNDATALDYYYELANL